ncbi:MAG: hypothetical protein L0229_19145, partial [Blastocatellia bacterium]|nr:hypothetical protein [Blastocatellia bacterium]
MLDWKDEIRRRLANLNLVPVRETEIVEELSQHMESLYEELLADGATQEEACQVLLEELSESRLLAEELRRVERQVRYEPVYCARGKMKVFPQWKTCLECAADSGALDAKVGS